MYSEKSPTYSGTISKRCVQQRVGSYALKRIPYVKTALHILEKVLYILKRAPYILILSRCTLCLTKSGHIYSGENPIF